MTEREYTIETLCICYSMEELNAQLRKLHNGAKHDGPDIIDGAPVDILEKAISSYNDEKYNDIREQIKKGKAEFGII